MTCQLGGHNCFTFSIVRCAFKQHWEFAVTLRPIYVGHERYAIPHLYLNAVVDSDLMSHLRSERYLLPCSPAMWPDYYQQGQDPLSRFAFHDVSIRPLNCLT